jgi:hypothetical protein
VEIKSVTSTTSAADSILHEEVRLLTAIYPRSGYRTSFNATSDYRIKTDVVLTLTDSLVDNLRPVSYIVKETNKRCIGFIAHELQEHYPYLVSGEKTKLMKR